MTFEEMRAEMRQKVVPENVIPQNITEYLMDDFAELPELDAFTFLNRLRALGIGSADFQYLLEGCGAPQECVEKIKNNPAMNLQNLILTLESSGMTSQDYTSILYTARQIWERTLTIRIEQIEEETEYEQAEKTEEIPQETEDVPEEYVNAEDEPSEEYRAPARPKVAEEYYDAFSDEESEDEDNDEPSLTEVLEQVKLLEKEMSYSDDEEETAISYEDEPEDSYEEIPDEQADANGELTENFSRVFDIIKEKKFSAEEPENAEVMSVTTILSEMGKATVREEKKGYVPVKDFDDIKEAQREKLAEELLDTDDEEETYPEEKSQPHNGDTTSLINIDPELLKKNSALTDENKTDEESETEETGDDDNYIGERRKSEKHYHLKSIIAAALGAVALTVLAVMVGKFAKKSPEIYTASENNDIFTKIYDSYNAGITGGETVCEYSGEVKIFGDLLVNNSGFTAFSDKEFVYTIKDGKISAKKIDGSAISESVIAPPDNTDVVTAFEQDDALYCIFSGEECGYMKIRNGTVLYTVRQDGKLCDFSVEGDRIAFGSVYVPKYSRDFSSDDTEVYLPNLGVGEKAPLTAEDIVISGTDGCSFAVCAEYSLKDGKVEESKAVLGNPVLASANFKAALNGKTDNEEYGLLISFKDELISKKCDTITAAAFGDDFAVTIDGDLVNVRDDNFTAKSIISNLPEQAENLKIDGKNLLMGNKDGFFAAFNCENVSTPAINKLTKTDGVFSGDNAMLFSLTDSLEITCCKNENGTLKTIGQFTKALTEEELDTLRLKGTETIVFTGESCGVAYEYFDGISVVCEYVVFGKENAVKTLYDDKTGFTLAFCEDGKIYAVSSEGVRAVSEG